MATEAAVTHAALRLSISVLTLLGCATPDEQKVLCDFLMTFSLWCRVAGGGAGVWAAL